MPTFYDVLAAGRTGQQEASNPLPGAGDIDSQRLHRPHGPRGQLMSLLYLLGTLRAKADPSLCLAFEAPVRHASSSLPRSPRAIPRARADPPQLGQPRLMLPSGPSSTSLPPGSHPALLSCLPNSVLPPRRPSAQPGGTRHAWQGLASPFLASPRDLIEEKSEVARPHPGPVITPAGG